MCEISTKTQRSRRARKSASSSPLASPAEGRPTAPGFEHPEGGKDLQQEIQQLRLLIRQVQELAGEERTVGELLNILEVVSKSSARLAALLKANRDLGGNELASSLQQALEELLQEWEAGEEHQP